MVVTQRLVVMVLALVLLLNACQTVLTPTPGLPRESLASLYEVRERAVDNGRLLKDMMVNNPDLLLVEGKEKYNKVFSSYNAAIEMIQDSILIPSGTDSADFKTALEKQVQRVQENGELLAQYTREHSASPRGIPEDVKSAVETVDVLVRLWEKNRDEERRRVSDALEDKKMVPFDDL